MGAKKKNGRPPWFKVPSSLRLTFMSVDANALGEGFLAALNYLEFGEEPEKFSSPMVVLVFRALKELCDEAVADYENKRKAGLEGAERKKAKRAAEEVPPPTDADAPPR